MSNLGPGVHAMLEHDLLEAANLILRARYDLREGMHRMRRLKGQAKKLGWPPERIAAFSRIDE